ncbi:MAG: hypothetical protein D6775_07795 [Caldilineae bacterium]|nr:MAG: hypothetical protein D6775_07795 [Caldilineae bacterium]
MPLQRPFFLRQLPGIVFLLVALLLNGCGGGRQVTPPPPSDELGIVVALIGEQPVYEVQWDQARRYAEATLRLLGEPNATIDEQRVFESFIEDMFIVQEASAQGFFVDKEAVELEEQRLLSVAGKTEADLDEVLAEVGLSRSAWEAELSRAVTAGAYLDEVVLADVPPAQRAAKRAAWLQDKKESLPVRLFFRPPAAIGVRVGDRAADIELPDLQGRVLRLSDMRGKAVLVNFWATWCLPCRDEMPLLQATYEKHNSQGLEILGVNVGEDRDTVQKFVAEFGLTFPVVLDRDQKVARRYRVYGIPQTFFITREGVIDFVVTGVLRASLLEERLQELLVSAKLDS